MQLGLGSHFPKLFKRSAHSARPHALRRFLLEFSDRLVVLAAYRRTLGPLGSLGGPLGILWGSFRSFGASGTSSGSPLVYFEDLGSPLGRLGPLGRPLGVL